MRDQNGRRGKKLFFFFFSPVLGFIPRQYSHTYKNKTNSRVTIAILQHLAVALLAELCIYYLQFSNTTSGGKGSTYASPKNRTAVAFLEPTLFKVFIAAKVR